MDADNVSISGTQKMGTCVSPKDTAPDTGVERASCRVRNEAGSQTENEGDAMQSWPESEQVAELTGSILGDGNIYDKRPTYVELCGNPTTDLEYFKRILIPIVNHELNREPQLFVRDGGLRFRINSRAFVAWLKEIGIPSGEAKASAIIPDFILKNRALLVCCIRGVFDTDGSVYFDLRPAYKRPYPRIDLHMTNARLLEQMDRLLNDFGIKHSFVRKKGSLITAGVDSLTKFLMVIGFSNPRHIRRIEARYPRLSRYNRVSPPEEPRDAVE